MSTALKTKNKKRWLVLLCVVILLAIPGYIFKWYLYVQYYDIAKNHFSKGDKVYADSSFFGEKRKYNIGLWRVVKPAADSLIAEKPYVMYCNSLIITNKLANEKSGFLGTYLFHKVLDLKIADKTVFTNYYAIKPNLKVYDSSGPNFYKPAKGYQWADSTIYILAEDVNNKESYK